MNAADFVSRLDAVRPSGNGWMAKCPAHEDRTASLSIADGRNGGVVMHCFAGCSVQAVCDALGLSLGDLFSPRIETYVPSVKPPQHNPKDLLRVIALEAALVLVAVRNLLNGVEFSDDDRERLSLAVQRIDAVMRHVA